MGPTYAERWRYREQWIEDRLKERGWSERKIKRGERYRKSEEYITVGIIWSLLILPIPIGLSLVVYGYYLRFRYQDLGEEYMRVRTDLKREFNHEGGPNRPGDRSARDGRLTGQLSRL